MSDTSDSETRPDPAVLAASASESLSAENPVHAVGIGPGNLEYLTPRGERAIRDAEVVVGFETVVEFVRERTDADLLTCGYRDEAETLAAFADRVSGGESGTAVLMGDPNHSGYQFLGKVQAAVDSPVRIVPGISSLQVAASRARTPMEESTFVTLHKSGAIASDLRRLREDVGDRHLLVLPRPYDWMPEDVAADLLDAGASPSLEALVLERLTHANEAVTETTLEGLSAMAAESAEDASPFSDLSVLAVRSR
ncbi:cobalt-precorrin-6Y C(5)-methyltransferase [Halogeometricum pallidum JCM 14848]|uniref:Cobalt-precorrin-6Y C(5)-methyltransferase n=1 Tax=Halogeometricum pallidum JCM 14848 TaxID=1227487 RepID=M0DGQ8_HALPD|nr:cobalt-precorrin-7 (C(5))-methyltransferase [Halogeometricum pallidum]ELZ33907.1 cobalt-precorrin-6Y C(5)-methyltransferase [Halogeometricum pallidum JCM 14848]